MGSKKSKLWERVDEIENTIESEEWTMEELEELLDRVTILIEGLKEEGGSAVRDD